MDARVPVPVPGFPQGGLWTEFRHPLVEAGTFSTSSPGRYCSPAVLSASAGPAGTGPVTVPEASWAPKF